MTRRTRTQCAGLWLAAAFIATQPASAKAADAVIAETRVFEILIDDKPAGKSTVQIVRYNDGTETAVTDAKISVNWLVFNYVYEFHGRERWHRGRLEQLDSRAVDGGRRLTLQAARTERGLTLAIPSRPAVQIAEVHSTTNFWRQPAAGAGAVAILDADNGKQTSFHIEPLPREELRLAGRAIACSHWRLSTTPPTELWFDDVGLLVRQIGVEDGHKTEARLVSVDHPSIAREGRTAQIMR